MMSHYKLYFAPGTCARVTILTLFETDIDFEPILIRFMKGQHRSPEYLQINPNGKVPLLIAGEKPLSENLAILTYLAKTHPDAGILPYTGEPLNDAKILSDLSWCSSGLHPIVTRIRMPNFMSNKEDATKSIYETACNAMQPNFCVINLRLSQQPWMLGDTWSALDAYIYWVWFRVTGAGFDGSAYPHYADHAIRMEQRDCYKNLIELETKAEKQLKEEGLIFTPPEPPK